MATFPITQKPSSFSETPTKSQIRSEFENGTVISRPRYSRGRSMFTLGWSFLHEASYQELVDFFYTNQGYTFSYEHPITGDMLTVRFSDDNVGEWKWAKPGYRSGSINIEEA